MDRSSEPAMQEIIKTVRQSGYSMHDILNSMGYYGFKLWSQEDVEAQFAAWCREQDSFLVSDGLIQLWEGKTAAEVGIKIQDWLDYKEYNRQDVEAERAVWHCISSKVRETEASIGNMQGR